MKKICSCLLFSYAILLFSDCGLRTGNGINRIWLYGDQMLEPDFDSCRLSPVSFLALHADGSYTMDFGHFDYGKWKASPTQIMLIDHQSNYKFYGMQYRWPDSLKLIARDGFVVSFEGQPSSFSSLSDDPFSLQNNQWRIPATHKENDAELRARLINHCHFWKMYFNWALRDDIDYIDVRSTPSPLKIYGNGFVLKNFEDQPGDWKAYFFDEQDCHQASEILRAVIRLHKIVVDQKGNKYKMFISMFQQMERALQ